MRSIKLLEKKSARNQYNEIFGLNLKSMVLEGVNDSLIFKLFLYLTCLATKNRLEKPVLSCRLRALKMTLIPAIRHSLETIVITCRFH